MSKTNINLFQTVKESLPLFIREQFPLFGELLEEYYSLLERKVGTYDIISRINQHIKVDDLSSLVEETQLSSEIFTDESRIFVESTQGFPERDGLIKIDNEIVYYKEKDQTSFLQCFRGFSGIDSYGESVQFSRTSAESHFAGTSVINLSSLLLKEFLEKIKLQFTPGFEGKSFSTGLNKNVFIKQSSDFYKSKGSDESFRILFSGLFGVPSTVIKPSEYVFEPSKSFYKITNDIVVEPIIGNPENCLNRTIYQRNSDGVLLSGVVNNVEKIYRADNYFYILSVDFEYDKQSDIGKFNYNNITKTTSDYVVGDTELFVDSTIGFENTSTLYAVFPDGDTYFVDYNNTTTTQFLNVRFSETNIPRGTRLISSNFAFVETDTEVIQMRICPILSRAVFDTNSQSLEKNDKVFLSSLGESSDQTKDNDWIFNIAVRNNVDTITQQDLRLRKYTVSFYENCDFFIGDTFTLFSSSGLEYTIEIISRNSNLEYSVTSDKVISDFSTPGFYTIKNINLPRFSNFNLRSKYPTGVQNVYLDPSSRDTYVTSGSLPYYGKENINILKPVLTFSGNYSGSDTLNVGPHSFSTGDIAIYSEPEFDEFGSTNSNVLTLPNSRYYVKVVDSQNIKLSTSKSNLFNNIFVTFSGNITNNKLYHVTLDNTNISDISIILSSPELFYDIGYQNVLKLLREKQDIGLGNNFTEPGPIGIFKNGVEIISYKSSDKIYYGNITDIKVIGGGENYDVINPPKLVVNDVTNYGTGYEGFFEVSGHLESIDVLNPGTGFYTDPIVKITGGEGFGAKVLPIKETVDYFVEFDSSNSTSVNTSTDTITFSNKVYFVNGERVKYTKNKGTQIGGLFDTGNYFVRKITDFSIKLYNNYEDSINNLNPIDITSLGSGIQTITAVNKRFVINKFEIISKGSNYRNKKIVFDSDSLFVNVYSDKITLNNHGLSTGEKIRYSTTGSSIEGLTSGNYYLVYKVDDNTIKLSDVDSSSEDFNLINKTFINFTSNGSGTHTIEYEPIQVTVTNLDNTVDDTFEIRPLFRGEITSVWTYNGGSNYGSDEITNYNRQPQIYAESGSGAKLKPIIINGKISSVIIENSGTNYFSIPEIKVYGSGYDAKIVPHIVNGQLDSVSILNPGVGYDNDTYFEVVSTGSNSEFFADIKNWTVNIVEKNLNKNVVSDDDGFLYKPNRTRFGLKYTHAYAPRKLRSYILTKRVESGIERYVSDINYSVIENRELDPRYHSPILGWAYDGNPIYGPYGFSNPDGTGNIKRLTSGYSLKSRVNGPSEDVYPLGYFVEDYEYFDGFDLDIHNGRFCITPEFPNGVYAYFCTVGDSDPSFNNYRRPVFPYVIGDTFKSSKIDFNFDGNINQFDFDYSNLLRNTTPYNIFDQNSGYDYVNQNENIQTHFSRIDSVSQGGVEEVTITSRGLNYKIGDKVSFSETSENPALVNVSLLNGKSVVSTGYTITSTEFFDLTNYSRDGRVAVSTLPHDLNSGLVFFYNAAKSNDLISFNATVPSGQLVLVSGIGNTSVTGMTTYINVYGNLKYPNILVNDVFTLGDDEEVKVLEIDEKSTRIRILRENNSVTGTSHTAGLILRERPRKLLYTNSEYSQIKNKQIYFNPKESVGVGIGTTVILENAGVHPSKFFINGKNIYLRSHNLSTNDLVVYNSNGGVPLTVSLNGSEFQLVDDVCLFANRINDNFIGLSTERLILNPDGSFSGVGSTSGGVLDLLTFTDYGDGDYHSLETFYEGTLNALVYKSTLTVNTEQDHLLESGDFINLDVNYNNQLTIKVVYNEENRRFGFNPLSFEDTSVDTLKHTIELKNHNLSTGQKVIHTSSSPLTQLSNNEIYYVSVIDNDRIGLSTNYQDSLDYVNLEFSDTSFGTILPINPPVNVARNKSILFDLSDPSLSYLRNSIRYPGFSFNLYYDRGLKNKFISTKQSDSFNVVYNGRIGIDSDAYVLLNYDESVPDTLFYNLDPIKDTNTPNYIYEIIVDDGQLNSINYRDSLYNKSYQITKLSNKSFRIDLDFIPEDATTNLKTVSEISYTTNSSNSSGEVGELNVIFEGSKYDKIPFISSITSTNGSGFIGYVNSNSIGKIEKLNIDNIGNDFTSDPTLSPKANPPVLLTIDPLASIESIKVNSFGKNYTKLPNLIVIDGTTNEPVEDIKLQFNSETLKVDILSNTTEIYNTLPTIIPINNSNGFKILSLDYDDFTKEATVILDVVGFSTLSSFPFTIGSKVLIENVVTLNPETDLGYNSENYNYALFTVTDNDPKIGGQNPSVTFRMEEYVGSNNPGFFNPTFTSSRIIPESYFPTFTINLKKNEFFNSETVTQGNNFRGTVSEWDSVNNTLRVETYDIVDLELGGLIKGNSSLSFGVVSNISGISTVRYILDSARVLTKRWDDNKGFLNDQNQRLHDSDYYQYFSYALNSTVSSDVWDPIVRDLNHTAGFKRFSNLSINSDIEDSGVPQEQNFGAFNGISNIDGSADLNCVYDFDLVTENSIRVGSNRFISDEIRFNSKLLQDYFESIGNRVLIVDDISDEFNSNPRATRFSVVDEFKVDEAKYKKYFIFTANKLFTSNRQSIIVNLLQNGTYGYLNQYGRVETVDPHGYFDFTIFGSYGYLLYYPIDYQFEDYNISGVSINVGENLTGIGVTSLGDIVSVASTYSTIPSGSAASVPVVISSDSSNYRSAKYIVTIESSDKQYLQVDELNIVHDGTQVYVTEFANLESSNNTQDIGVGFCTYYPTVNVSNLTLSLVPNFNLPQDYDINIVSTFISDDTLTSVGQTVLNTSRIESEYVSIASSSAPSPGLVTSIARSYDAFYMLASIEDSTNNYYQFTELVAVRDNTDVYFTEFGTVLSEESLYPTGIGTFTGTINLSTEETELYFEPLPDIDVEVRVLIYSVENVDLAKVYTSIDLDQSKISTLYGEYYGTDNDIRRSFELLYNGLPIFQRVFNSEDSDVVSISDNVVILPNHFFVTGEKIIYEYNTDSFVPDQPIGIATTTISGIGLTDKLPTELYVIKVDNSSIKFADTAENALKYNPSPLTITSVGIGTQHTFTSTNKNAKCIFTIDNVIQSPVVETGINYELTANVAADDVNIKLSGISSIFAKDIVKINDEIMLIESVGIGSEELVRVRRRWMGEDQAVSHSIGSTVSKLAGNYTIYNNNVDFASAPYGKVPLTQPQNQVGAPIVRPDDRDFTGITTSSYFSGRVFLRSGETDTLNEVYTSNVVFDDISKQFNGISSEFSLKVGGNDVTGISTNNGIFLIKDVFQQPSRTGVSSIVGNYVLLEDSGETKIQYIPSTQEVNDDINVTSLPVGGVIVSVGSTNGFAYQPLISAGGTASISGFGTISSISIGNSGSGYRSGIQTYVNVYAQTSSSIETIGTATVSNGNIVSVAVTNPGTGYTSSNPPLIIFESPLGYSNLPLKYSSDSVQGIGTGAKIDLVVSQDSSILDFKLSNNGYAYEEGEILTVDIGGEVGIPTDLSKTFEEFQITVKSIYNDEFSAWSIGDLQQLDPFDNLFDGVRKVFPIKYQGNRVSIIAKNGSNIDIEATLLIFINGILQIPGRSYTFRGGSILAFSEAPKPEYTSNILFYRGTPNIDVRFVDIIEPIEEGDTAQIHSDNIDQREETRQIEEIISADIVLTNPYSGPGRVQDETIQRPVNVCKQTEDLFINGVLISKARSLYEPIIHPTTNIIQNVSTSSTDMFVESLKTFFDNETENLSTFELSQIEITSQDVLQTGIASVTVSAAGSVTSIDIINSGIGYTFAPTISIANPPSTSSNGVRAEAELIVVDGSISSYNITNFGRGYNSNNPPSVIIENPKLVSEKIINVTYEGDFGYITGVAQTTVGAGLTAISLDFYIDEESFIRDLNINSQDQSITGISGISTGYFFVVSNSNIGLGITSLYNDGSILSSTEDYFDVVFQVYDLEIKNKVVAGVGTTTIVQVYSLTESNIDLSLPSFDNSLLTLDSTLLSFDSNSNSFSYFGNFSWGRIIFDEVRSRRNNRNFNSYYSNGYSGIETSSVVRRFNSLRYDSYDNINNI